ncbi:MAG: class F sortase [Actinomycetota bacterium]
MKRSWIYAPMIWAITCLLTAATFRVIQIQKGRVEEPGAPFLTAPQVSSAKPREEAQPADPPVQIAIPSVGITAAVDPLGLNPDGSIEVPKDFSRTGWYTGLEVPGSAGTGVIVGHLDSKTGPAVFYGLGKVRSGDEVSLTLQSGATKMFIVQAEQRFSKAKFPTIQVYAPSTKPVLRLITCGGDFDKKSGHYRDNLVVYAAATEA